VIAAQREMEAAQNEAEAQRIRLVGVAEAEKTSKRLQGEGIAAQRLAIAEGYHEAMDKLKTAMPQTSEETILAMLMMTNHWDTIRDAAAGKGNVIMVNGSGNQATDDLANMAAAFRVSNDTKAA
ncbi:MAG: SPFH domain-containing protein, partial [Myxococcota bacterium]